MSISPIKTWSYPGALLDALVDTRKAVADIELPIPVEGVTEAQALVSQTLDQLDHHLIPRVKDEASPAIVVVAGSTGSGKSTVVNALLGENLTPAGVLRPTTKTPYLFHHPLDTQVLTPVERRATMAATEAVPRGLAIVDSPDLDSVRGENREVARELLDAADLWIFVTTAARYGDAVPWQALRSGAERGASIAIVLNRVTMDVAAQVRSDLVSRLHDEGLEMLPLFVIPEDTAAHGDVPADVVGGLGRWLDSVAAASAATIVERTLHGSAEALKEWLERLAEHMDDQASVAKEVRAVVRRRAAQAETDGGDGWYEGVATGALETRWRQATSEGGPLFRLRNSLWTKRRVAREARDAALNAIEADVIGAVEATLTFAASKAAEGIVADLAIGGEGPGTWLAAQRDPRDAREHRERTAADATRAWLGRCDEIAMGLAGAKSAVEVVGETGLRATLASAALGVGAAHEALTLLAGRDTDGALAAAREELGAARRYAINREALEVLAPTDIASLMPDASAKVRLRRAELRGLL